MSFLSRNNNEIDRPSTILGGQILIRIKQRIKNFRCTFENSCGICCVADTQTPFVAKIKGNGKE